MAAKKWPIFAATELEDVMRRHIRSFTLVSVIAGLLVVLALDSASAKTVRKRVQQDTTTLVYEHVFFGPVRGGKLPTYSLEQTENGKLSVKVTKSKQGNKETWTYEVYYTPRQGFTGRDKGTFNYVAHPPNGQSVKFVYNLRLNVR